MITLLFNLGFCALMKACQFGTQCLGSQDIFCPQKPHHFDNKYCLTCCGIGRVMLNDELMEGKDLLATLIKPEYDAPRQQACGFLLQIHCKHFLTGRYFILDLGFCVMKEIEKLKNGRALCCCIDK